MASRLQIARRLANAALLGVFALTTAPPARAQGQPSEFVTAAAQSDQYEIQAGEVALSRAQDPQVRAFAQRMVQDHTRTREALEQAARAAGLPAPPKAVGGEQQRMLAELQSLRGPDFDRAYVRQQVLAHEQALAVQQGYAASGAEPNLRKAARSAAPLVSHHLELARQLRSAVAGA